MSDLQCLQRYVANEEEWIASGRVLLCPGMVDFREWMAVKVNEYDPEEYARRGSVREQTLYSKCVVRGDGVVHAVERLVPGSGKFLLHHYDWGDARGGSVKWPYW